MREIDCYECDGSGWGYEIENGLPLQCTCDVCKGAKKITVTDEFARFILGEEAHE